MAFSLSSLVVCADAPSVQVLSRILREMGIRAENCGDTQTAASRLTADAFDAVLVDCADEKAAGELLAAVRGGINREALVVIIVDTANDVRELFAKGANVALYKPVSFERAGNTLRAARSLMSHERRRLKRVPAHGPVTISYSGSENVPAQLLDLSDDGIAIRAERALPPYCKVYFEFKLPNKNTQVKLSGEVVWTDFTGRVGLHFARVPQSSRQVLDAWLKENAPQHEPATAPAPPVETVESIPLAVPDEEARSESERRVQSRLACRIGAEIYPMGSKVPHRCNLLDISPGGCYVETTSPLPAGTAIDIVVRTNHLRVHLKGSVRSAHPGYGMGVEFTVKTAEQQRQLKQLIAWQAEATQAAVESQ